MITNVLPPFFMVHSVLLLLLLLLLLPPAATATATATATTTTTTTTTTTITTTSTAQVSLFEELRPCLAHTTLQSLYLLYQPPFCKRSPKTYLFKLQQSASEENLYCAIDANALLSLLLVLPLLLLLILLLLLLLPSPPSLLQPRHQCSISGYY